MTQAHYIHQICFIMDFQYIAIIYLNNGIMSVKNDIENVVEEIASREGINPENYPILYQDGGRIWDGWDHKYRTYINCREILPTNALIAFLKVIPGRFPKLRLKAEINYPMESIKVIRDTLLGTKLDHTFTFDQIFPFVKTATADNYILKVEDFLRAIGYYQEGAI